MVKPFPTYVINTLIALTASILLSCSRPVPLQVMRPADIDVPPHINKVALVNRTIPSSAVGDIFEGVFTGEGVGQDQEAVQALLGSLNQALGRSPRLSSVIHSKSYKTGNSGLTTNFPEPMDWAKIQTICRETTSDAVVAIEVFDSDWVVTNGQTETTDEDESGREVKVITYTAEGVATIKAGIRFYDPKTRGIIDQQTFQEVHTWNATGETATDALAALIVKRQAVIETGRFAGDDYSLHIAPQLITVSRVIYGRGKKDVNLKVGARRADVGDWDGAIQAWQRTLSTSSHSKAMGRACNNLAVAYEMKGDLEEALKYAQRGWSDFRNQGAKSYAQVLQRRIEDERRLDFQLEGRN